MNVYQVTFDRIGFNPDVPPLVVQAADEHDLADRIFREARKHLLSRHYEVVLETGAARGVITIGFPPRPAGEFVIEIIDPSGESGGGR